MKVFGVRLFCVFDVNELGKGKVTKKFINGIIPLLVNERSSLFLL